MKAQKYKLTVFCLLLCMASPLFSQDSTFSLGGFVQYDHISYFKNVDQKVNNRNEGMIQLTLSTKLSKTSYFKAVAEVREDVSDARRNRVWIDEMILRQSMGPVDVSLGKHLISWGTTDGINPVNTINPVDYSDLLDTEEERIGVYGVRTQLYLSGFDMDLFWSPFPTTGKLPAPDSRWFPSPEGMGIPPGPGITDIPVGIDDQPPAMRLDDGELGLRLRRRFAGFDLAASYYSGYDHLPEYQPDTAGLLAEQPRLIFRATYQRQQVAGLEMSFALPGGAGLRNETALFMPDGNSEDNDSYIQTITGIDRSFSIGRSDLLVIIQYMYDLNLEGNRFDPIDLRHIFSNSLILHAELNLSGGISLNHLMMIKLDSRDILMRNELAYQGPAGMRFSIASDILEGDPGTFLGSYTENDRIQCTFRYTF